MYEPQNQELTNETQCNNECDQTQQGTKKKSISKVGIIAIITIVIAIVVASTLLIALPSNNGTSNPQTTTSTTISSTKRTTTTKVTISVSKREDLAKTAVLKAALREMRSGGTSYLFKNYDVEATKYKIGKVEKNEDRFKFHITFYLYDNYGNYKNKIQKTISVDVDEYGKVGYVAVSFSKWEFN